MKYFHARWIEAHTPLHHAGYMLDPKYWNLDLMSNVEVIQNFYNMVNTFYVDVDDHIKCIKKLPSFQLKEGLLLVYFVQKMTK